MSRERKRAKKPKAQAAPMQPIDPANPSLASIYGTNADGDPEVNISGVMQYLDAMSKQARAANETRYAEQIATLNDNFGQADQVLNGMGTTAKADNARAFGDAEGDFTQDAITRGTFNTSLLDALKLRNREGLARANLAVDESVADRRSGLLERKGQAVAGAIESRIDEGPDTAAYLGLVGQAQAEKAAQRQRKQEQERMDREYQDYLDEPVQYIDTWRGSQVRTRRGDIRPATIRT